MNLIFTGNIFTSIWQGKMILHFRPFKNPVNKLLYMVWYTTNYAKNKNKSKAGKKVVFEIRGTRVVTEKCRDIMMITSKPWYDDDVHDDDDDDDDDSLIIMILLFVHSSPARGIYRLVYFQPQLFNPSLSYFSLVNGQRAKKPLS